MSHFIALVMLDEEEVKDVSAAVNKRMQPYDEGIAVPEYDAVCQCKEWKLFSEVNLKLHEEQQDIESYRKSFAYWSAEKEFDYNLDDEDERERFHDEMRKAWVNHIEPHQKRRDEIRKELEPDVGIDPYCDECNGTGTYISTYNINSKWDWYVIGGRWDGFFADREAGDPYANRIDGNIASVQDAKSLGEEKLPFAVLSPEGWHERGQMHSFATVSGEKEQSNWMDEVSSLYDRYPDHHVVAVDCHV